MKWGILGHRTESETIRGWQACDKGALRNQRIQGGRSKLHQAPEKGECVRQTEGHILWILHIMKWTLDPTLHFWVSRKYHVKTTWLAWKFSVVPTWESGERPGCLAWAHNDCQGTSCCCLKNILQLPGFDVLQIPSIMELPGQYWMKTNTGYCGTK